MLLLKLTWFFVLVIVLKILQCPYSLMHFNVRNKIYKSLNLWYILLLFSCSVMSDSLWPCELQHVRLPCPSPSPGACSNSFLLSQWCHSNILSSVVPVSSCLQSFPASASFPMNRLFTSGGQSIGASASVSALPKDSQSFQWIFQWFPLGLTGLISLLSKGLSRVFSSTTVQKHQFEKMLNFLIWDIWLPLLNTNLLMFRLPAFSCKTSV